jgi:Phosphodiester glycosidase
VEIASRFANRVEPPGQQSRPLRQRLSRPSGRRRWVGAAGAVIVVLLVWLTWSIGGALTAPGSGSTSARLAEWARSNGLGWAVTGTGQVHHQPKPPVVGRTRAGGILRVSAAPVPGHRPGPARRMPRNRPGPARPTSSHRAGPAAVPPQAQPSSPGAVWQPLVSVHGKPAILAEFVRPDAQHANDPVGVAWLDQKLVRLVLHPGYNVPGGSGWSQPSQVPASERDSLLATFNSGFKMVDSYGGYWQDGRTAVPLRRGAASMVLYKDGHLDVVRWNAGTPGPEVAAVRQNLDLMVDNGAITAEVTNGTTRTWGNTVGNATFVWRTALGVRRDGSLVFVAGSSLSAYTLANVVRDAGAVRAMELDINQSWTNFITYTHPGHGVAVPHMLTMDEHPNPYRYLQPSARDFVAVLAR